MSVLVGRRAPDFNAVAVLGDGQINEQYRLAEDIKGKCALLFFYPLDFTFVCPSELIALNNRLDEFKKRDIEVIAVSIDSQYTHNAWRNTPIKDGGIGKVGYKLIADINHNICKTYGVEHPEAEVALRGAFLIDKNGIVRSEVVNDLPIGRNIDELLRLFDAIRFHEENGDVCPAGWQEGKASIKATDDGIASYLEENADKL